MTNTTKIYQIFYDDESRNKLDPGFLPLDNRPNERPDWREYHPIRRYLLNNHLDSNCYYGFLSPKFAEKSRLNSRDVYKFIEPSKNENIDVFIFSPYFDQTAFHLNIFIQAIIPHKNIETIFDRLFLLYQPSYDWKKIVTDSRNTVFCNFFVAKPNFWNEWFDICEKIYSLAEDKNSELYLQLNDIATHRSSTNFLHEAQFKVFVIERMATYILTSSARFQSKAFPAESLPKTKAFFNDKNSALIQMDALKIAFNNTHNQAYLNLFNQIQKIIIDNAR
jgi:hypothetical protein